MEVSLKLIFGQANIGQTNEKECAKFKCAELNTQVFFSKEVGISLLNHLTHYFILSKKDISSFTSIIKSSNLQDQLTEDDIKESQKIIKRIETLLLLKDIEILNSLELNNNTTMN